MTRKIVVLCCLFLAFFEVDLRASSLGPSGGINVSGKYGGDDFLMALGPPPGLYLINYTFFYSADKFKDYGGDEVRSGPFSGFETTLFGNTFRPIYVMEKKIFGSYWAMDMGIPLIEKRVECELFDKRTRGVGDIVLCPIWLHWDKGILHFLLSFDFMAPTGKYDKKRYVNIGNNHWTFEPLFGTTVILPWNMDINLNLLYDYNWKNGSYIDPRDGQDADYKSGQNFHLDYSVGYGINDNLRVGVAGFFWKDLTDDEINGHRISDSRGQVLAIGPAIAFSFDRLTLSLKAEFETMVKNRPQGVLSWLRILYSF